jgi:hypothetical protein
VHKSGNYTHFEHKQKRKMVELVIRKSEMTNLIFSQVTGHHICLHVADSSMSESVHSTGRDTKTFAKRSKNPSANVSVFQWRANS